MRSRALDLTILALGLVLGLGWATQYIGSGFGYDPRLGFEVGRWQGYPLYWPYAGLYWASTPLLRNGPKVFDIAELILLGCFGLAIAVVALRRPRRVVTEFGKGACGSPKDA